MSSLIRGSTKVCGLFGYPVEHSFSPAMQNAAFSYCGLDYVYVPFLVAPGELPRAVQAVKALNLAGVNVTVPHKEEVVPLLSELAPEARLIGAVNTIVYKQEKLVGYNTDGAGLLQALKNEAGFLPEGKGILLLGSGGAARAVSLALATAGARLIYLANRTFSKAQHLAKEISKKTQARATPIPWSEQELGKVIENVCLIIQATSVGMYPHYEFYLPFPFHHLKPQHTVCDLIYNPPRTIFLKQAQKAGAKILNGLGMLLYQGALSFELWTGQEAPKDVMYRALIEQLEKHGG